MKKTKKILVVLGGTSKERKVSLESGKACIKAIKSLGYRVESFDRSETGNISALRGHAANTSMLSGFQYGMTPDPTKRRTSKRLLVPSRFNLQGAV